MSAENDNDPLPEEMGQGDGQDDIVREIAALRTEADNQKDRALRALAEVENVLQGSDRERRSRRPREIEQRGGGVGSGAGRALGVAPQIA